MPKPGIWGNQHRHCGMRQDREQATCRADPNDGGSGSSTGFACPRMSKSRQNVIDAKGQFLWVTQYAHLMSGIKSAILPRDAIMFLLQNHYVENHSPHANRHSFLRLLSSSCTQCRRWLSTSVPSKWQENRQSFLRLLSNSCPQWRCWPSSSVPSKWQGNCQTCNRRQGRLTSEAAPPH